MITNIIINTILQFKKIKLYFLNKKKKTTTIKRLANQSLCKPQYVGTATPPR